MNGAEVAARRLVSQGIAAPLSPRLATTVKRLAALQAQDFSLAKWAIGLRTRGVDEAAVDRAFDRGALLRTHLLRPTWHFVVPEDLRWLLALTAPRVHALNRPYYRKLGLDSNTLRRSNAALVKALGQSRFLTRDQLREVLTRAKIDTSDNLRVTYLMMFAELEGIVVSGPRQGKQFTYGLIDERVPPVASIDRADALVRLADRYFTSRGPASAADFAKWSGLTIADAQLGLEAVRSRLDHWETDGRPLAGPPRARLSTRRASAAHLLSIYDEYISGYRDRSAIVDGRIGRNLIAMGNDLTAVVVLDGVIVGTWKRTVGSDDVAIDLSLFVRPTPGQSRAIGAAAARFGEFVGKTPLVTTRLVRS